MIQQFFPRMLCLLLLLNGANGCGGPIAGIPGGKLSGPEQPWTETTVPTKDGVMVLETRPSDPYSVNVGYRVIEGNIYIDPAPERTWYKNMQANPNVRVCLDGAETIFSAKVVPENDAAIQKMFETDRIVLRIVPRG